MNRTYHHIKNKKGFFNQRVQFSSRFCSFISMILVLIGFIQGGMAQEHETKTPQTISLLTQPEVKTITIPGFSDKKILTWQPDAGTTAVLVQDHRAPLIFIDIKVDGWASPFYESRERLANQPTMRNKLQNLSMDLKTSDRIEISFLKEDLYPAIDVLREILYDHPPSPKTHSKKRFQSKLLRVQKQS